MRVEPGDVERAVKEILDLITKTAEPFDPPDQAKFYTHLVAALGLHLLTPHLRQEAFGMYLTCHCQ